MQKYPDDFLWGASTASHQVEGGTHNQWSEWERANAGRLATESPKDLAWLPRYAEHRRAMAAPENYISGSGVDHYNRYEEDFTILQQLSMNSFRFSIEWSRLEPTEGNWDEAAIEHYRQYIAALKARGIEPIMTLWHWTLPVWFTNKGGFEKRTNLHYFERYATKLAQEFGGQLRYVLTLNEPNVYASFSYALGLWPPARKNPVQMLAVYRNLAQAHRLAYKAFKTVAPQVKIGLAQQLGDTQPCKPGSPLNHTVVRLLAYAWNWWFINRLRGSLDYIGVNYYFTEYRDRLGRIRNPKGPLSDLGWYMEPAGIGRLLAETYRRYKLPLLVTENGVADSDDNFRQWWLQETLAAMDTALADGIPLIGYLHWSLLDNFEWAYGWWPKFGLVAVNRTTMQRTVRPSAYWLAKQIAARSKK